MTRGVRIINPNRAGDQALSYINIRFEDVRQSEILISSKKLLHIEYTFVICLLLSGMI